MRASNGAAFGIWRLLPLVLVYAFATAGAIAGDPAIVVLEHVRAAQQSKLSSAPHGRAEVMLVRNSGEHLRERTEHVVEWDDRGRVRWSGSVSLDKSGKAPASQFEAAYDPDLDRLEIIRHIDGLGGVEIQQPAVQWPSWLKSTPRQGWFGIPFTDRFTLADAVAWQGNDQAKREVAQDPKAKELAIRIIQPDTGPGEWESNVVYDVGHDLLFKRGSLARGMYVGDCVWTRNSKGIVIPERIAWRGPEEAGPPSAETWPVFAVYKNVDLDYLPSPSRFRLSRDVLKPGSLVVQVIKGDRRAWRVGDDEAPTLDSLLEQAGDAAAGTGLAKDPQP